MRLTRFTVRRLMIVVAVLAIVLWLGTIVTRWVHYRNQSMIYSELVRAFEMERLVIQERLKAIPPDNPATRERLESVIADKRQEIIKSSILADRYRRAMQRPWYRVDPDAIEPKGPFP
jgi:hypothetical protein